jgi:hypothetical protein
VNKSFAIWPLEARRAVARNEMRKRGIKFEKVDEAMNAAFAAFYSGPGLRPADPGFEATVRQLGQRIDENTLTADDMQFLSTIPPGSLSGVEIARTFVQIFDEL